MAESEEALQLKRRARRRLVGAIALLTFVVIVLPLILDKEPGPAGPPLSVQIPDQEAGGFNTRIVPPAPAVPAATLPRKKSRDRSSQSRTGFGHGRTPCSYCRTRRAQGECAGGRGGQGAQGRGVAGAGCAQ